MRFKMLGILVAGGLAGCGVPLPSPVADSQNRVVDIVNTSSASLSFYAVNAERRGAFRGRFAEQGLGEKSYVTINFVDGSGACRFDLHAVFADGSRAAQPGFDTCAEVSWVISPEDFQ